MTEPTRGRIFRRTRPTEPDPLVTGGVRWCAADGCKHIACDREHDHLGGAMACRGALCPSHGGAA